jgi:hypothetical protein
MKTVKLFFATMAVAAVAMVAASQASAEEKNDCKYGPYLTNGLWDNWFVTAGGGIQVYFGESDTHGDFSDRIAPALDISVGKWITPSVGMRLQYSGLKAKGWTDGLLPYSHGSADAGGYYKEKFNRELQGDYAIQKG